MIIMTNTQKTELRNVIVNFVKNSNGWEGTTSQLLRKVSKSLSSELKTNSPSIFKQRLNTIVRSIRNQGVSVKFTQTAGNNSRKLIKFSV